MNKKSNNSVLYIVQAGIIGAMYVALTWLSSLLGLAYGGVQFRLSEALTVLPVFTPAAVPGLFIGCVISNIFSPMGFVDVVFGSAATLSAALCTRWLRRTSVKGLPVPALIPPVLFNAVIIGLEIVFFLPGEAASLAAFGAAALGVGAGQAAVCFGLGLPLAALLKKIKIFDYFIAS